MKDFFKFNFWPVHWKDPSTSVLRLNVVMSTFNPPFFRTLAPKGRSMRHFTLFGCICAQKGRFQIP